MLDYSSVEYWDERFARSPAPFDWLKTPEEITPRLERIIANIPRNERRILHIGSGSSSLTLRLRDLVHGPPLIHNIDFSSSALEAGKRCELQGVDKLFKANQTMGMAALMEWTQADLLSMQDVSRLYDTIEKSGPYTIIVDKGTSDAIACGPSIEIDDDVFGSQLHAAQGAHDGLANRSRFRLYPVWLLALHMALLTPPGALWMAISYKEDRFSFFTSKTPVRDLRGKDVPAIILPTTYWYLKSKEFIVDSGSTVQTGLDEVVHRRASGKWLVVLERTDNR